MKPIKAVRAAAFILAIAYMGPARASEPLTLKFAFSPPLTNYLNTKGMTPWIQKVEKASDREVKIKLFSGYTLATSRNVYERTLANVAQISFGVFGQLPSQFPLVQVANLPFLSSNAKVSSVALWRLYERGSFAPEFSEVKVLALFNFNSSALNTARTVRTLNDLEGMKLAVSSRIFADVVTALGASPVTLAVPEMYEAMNRGVMDGIVTSLLTEKGFRLDELTKNHLLVPLGEAPAYVFMNKTAYAKLPATAKKAIDKYSGEPFSETLGAITEAAGQAARANLMRRPGQHLNRLSSKQEAIWQARIEPVISDWTKNRPHGVEVLSAYRNEIKEVRKSM